MQRQGDHYGLHRVVARPGDFPQAAERLNPHLPIYDNEILIDVEFLNIDAASFHQMGEKVNGDSEGVKRQILEIVAHRGKMHNPVTQSGGMLLGTVKEIGDKALGRGFQQGERIATLVSLTLTPLHLDAIQAIDMPNDQVQVRGHAILFESGIAHRLPSDLPEQVTLSIFDVCGAPALLSHHVRAGETVVIFGAGKAGVLAAAEARKKVGKGGAIYLLEQNPQALQAAAQLPFVTAIHPADLRQPKETMDLVSQLTQGKMADLVVNCVNVPKTEMASILAAKRSGKVLFFNMATSFQAVVLGAEGVGHETQLIMGNGYTPGHADLAIQLVRHNPELLGWFTKRMAVP